MPSQRQLFRLFVPLALSGAFFPIARPIINAALARTDDPALALAAFSVTLSITMPLVSPLFGMRQIVTALCVDRQMIRLLARLVWILGGGATVLLLVFSIPSVYVATVDSVLGIPRDIALLGPPAMLWMATSPLLSIGRGYYQGILVSFGHAGPIGLGALLYLAGASAAVFPAILWLGMPGAVAAALSLFVGNLVYVAAVWLPTRPMFRGPSPRIPERAAAFGEDRRSTRYILSLYLPLAVSTILTAFMEPAIQAGIARSPMTAVSLAAYPVSVSLAWLARTHLWNAQQVVIPHVKDNATYLSARRFMLTLSLATTVLMAVPLIPPVGEWVFGDLTGLQGEVKDLAWRGYGLLIAVPFLQGWRSLYHGTLVALGNTKGIQTAAIARGIALVATLVFLVLDGRMIGLYVGVGATLISELAEVLMLKVSVSRLLHTRP
jgi:hypothetical protein